MIILFSFISQRGNSPRAKFTDKFPNHSVSIRYNPAERHTFNQTKQSKNIEAYEHYHDTEIREDNHQENRQGFDEVGAPP
ncbi:hypothetical protein ABG827_13530 [Phocaeicola vulgatus]|uniref:hypothetical protein n=1 Tax=Bacteroidaceae TaxID=815 RepID=UPI0012F4A62F|nr:MULTISPECIES: hypothetical protein [Bacteroides]MCE8780495.1 hypothetical protein [Bacteroides thetaiotaomicron]